MPGLHTLLQPSMPQVKGKDLTSQWVVALHGELFHKECQSGWRTRGVAAGLKGFWGPLPSPHTHSPKVVLGPRCIRHNLPRCQ